MIMLLQSVTISKAFLTFFVQQSVAEFFLLQSVKDCYYQVRQVLQSEIVITK